MSRSESFLIPEPFAFVRDLATRWDAAAIVVVIGLLAFFAAASRGVLEPLTRLAATPLSLDPSHLPYYAARTTLRMFAAMALSLLFTFSYATWAAKSERAAKLLIPILDILQSVPILGFLSVTVVFFMSLAPGRVLGAEFAAIFAIFTSQAWNMAFSFYQSLRTVPDELAEAADSFLLSPWMRFWQLEVPFAMPALLWNMMMSMSGSWFFVVAAEYISVGHTTVALPGIGSYIALAIQQRNLHAIGWAILAMLIVILVYDQLLFRPLVAWSDRFRVEQQPGAEAPQSWALTMLNRSRLMRALTALFHGFVRSSSRALALRGRSGPREGARAGRALRSGTPARHRRVQDLPFFILVLLLVGWAIWRIATVLIGQTSLDQVVHVSELTTFTMARVVVLIGLSSVVWVPVGVWVGMRPRATQIVQPIAQFLAAFPANLLFPLVVLAIVTWQLNPDVFLSPLMVLGTQWYILFNVIAGAAAMPAELRDAAQNLRVGGVLWWRRVAIPGILPYFVTGAITASGGAWNAAYVAEVASWGKEHVQAHGVGAYIADATAAGDMHRVILGITMMSLFVTVLNRVFWRPLYYYAERKFRLA